MKRQVGRNTEGGPSRKGRVLQEFSKNEIERQLIRNVYIEKCAMEHFKMYTRQCSSSLVQGMSATGVDESKKNWWEILEKALREAGRLSYCKFSGTFTVRNGTTFFLFLIFQNCVFSISCHISHECWN